MCISDESLFPLSSPIHTASFKITYGFWLVNDASSLFFIAYIDPIQRFIFSLITPIEKLCKVFGEISMSKETWVSSNKSQFVVKLSCLGSPGGGSLVAILWKLEGTIFKIKIFLQAFRVFETLLGFVVSLSVLNTPFNPSFWAGLATAFLGDGSGTREEILPKMRSNGASGVLNFKPSWVLFRSGLAGSWILNAHASKCS